MVDNNFPGAVGYQRFPQLLRRKPPPRTRLIINSSAAAPMVALMIAATTPAPSWMPSCGSSQLPKKAPTMPMKWCLGGDDRG
jgi:hypothetical protein